MLIFEIVGAIGFGTITFQFVTILICAVILATVVIVRKSFVDEISTFSKRHRNNSSMFQQRGRRFNPEKQLDTKEQIMLEMLQDKNADNKLPVNFVITDPVFIDNPIIFASDGFCSFTGYNKKEVENRNCRFLQGPDTEQSEVAKIRQAIEDEEEVTVELLNYKKDGTPFRNRFYLCPLRGSDNKLAYFLGVQLELTEETQLSQNAGEKLFKWLS